MGIPFLSAPPAREEAMAHSAPIPLMPAGALEQVPPPRETYEHLATAYTARFIGQTNLLRGEILDGMARCGAIEWPSDDPGGAAIFSLRPEAIRLASDAVALPGTARFRAALQQQFFSGASELLEVNCSGQLLRVRISARGPLSRSEERRV